MRPLFLLAASLVFVAGCGNSGSTPQQEAIMKQDRTAWKKLAKGMTQDKVRTLLGEPLRTEDRGDVTCWYFKESRSLEKDAANGKNWVVPRGAVLFSQKSGGSKLAEWREP